MPNLSRQGGDILSSILALVGSKEPAAESNEAPNLDGNEFVGTWAVEDSNGEPFEITLSASAAAEANRDGEGMTGTWDADGPSAVISWNTGWTTKITRTGDAFVKTAYDTTAAAPTNTSPAEKVA
jgi:hypothetical protein